MQKPQRFLVPLAMLGLLLGILSGWLRLGWNLPLSIAAGEHGLLMVGGFLGTLISLERAVVVKTRWALLVPLVQALAVVMLLFDQFALAIWLFMAGAMGMAVIIYSFLHRFQEPFYYLLFGGSLCLLIGHVFLLRTHFYPTAVPWWMAFLLLTITAERLELSRFVPLKPYQRLLLWLALGVFLVGVAQPFHGFGQSLTGVGMVLVGAWLLRFDMARRLLLRTGQQRYMGGLLVLGYGWLLVSGLLLALPVTFPFVYDATLHTFFTGFVFSMIFAHGPVILPGVLSLRGNFYRPMLYVGALGQSVGLLTRVIGDMTTDAPLRLAGGLIQGCTILFFMGCMLVTILRSASNVATAR
ncbi:MULTISPECIES: hypothetical protein [unclassified Spirosoma]|uniref:hypothetical protein n=1 Tax=unclassified Spirosoma TaxID=2621999 RepID=UPI0025DF82A8|nr:MULTISPECIES: hypothetical protein [unclassified Spirosoma]